MESLDRKSSAQVWERVFQPPVPQPPEDLRPLMRTAMELAAVYQYLAGLLAGKQRERVQRLGEGERANLAALKGVAFLQGQGDEILKIWKPSKRPIRTLLEGAYRQTRRSMSEYLSRSAEPEYGHVFRELADREVRHCLWLAEVLGGM